MKLGIIGGGVVGSALVRCYLEHVEEIRVYDVIKERKSHSLENTLDTDLIFICLPTPADKGRLDTGFIDTFVEENKSELSKRRLVLKSTVPIGYTRKLQQIYSLPQLCHSPEFLTHRCRFTDIQFPSRNIVGCPGRIPNSSSNLLINLYSARFPATPIYHLSSDESEAVKLFTNSFFAVKIAFFNEINMLSKSLGMNWQRVSQALLADERIGYSHTKVPGPDGKYGFGGSCLPKDLGELAYSGEHMTILLAALLRNYLKDRKREE